MRDGGGSEKREGSGSNRGGGRRAAALMLWRGRARWCQERGEDVHSGGEREEGTCRWGGDMRSNGDSEEVSMAASRAR